MQTEKLRFPIGRSPFPEAFNPIETERNIQDISALPDQLSQVLAATTMKKLGNIYRENGWTGLQVLHHISDSHINAFCRLKLALTEDNPTIKPYEEQDWAKLADYDESMYASTLILIKAIHQKWAYVLRSLTDSQWQRTFYHPGNRQITALFQHAAIYSWHGRHHLEHIKLALAR